jgi:hypothetical protein
MSQTPKRSGCYKRFRRCTITAVGSGNAWPTMGSVHPWYGTAAIMTSVLKTQTRSAANCKVCGLTSCYELQAAGVCNADTRLVRTADINYALVTEALHLIRTKLIQTFSLFNEDKIWSPAFICWCGDISKRSVQFIFRTNNYIQSCFISSYSGIRFCYQPLRCWK